MRILLIEDDTDMADTIKSILKRRYVVDIAHRGSRGLYKALTNEYDAIIIDYVLPDMSGLDICMNLRNEGIRTPVMFLTAQFYVRNKVRALNAGADDYVLKPFSSHELTARIRALMRRHVGHYKQDVLTAGDLTIDAVRRIVIRQGKHIKLRKKAFDLLEYLLRNKGRVLSRDTILEHVWESQGDDMSNTVDVHIRYLRDKVDKPFQDNLIHTIYGLGYRLASKDDMAG